jgi:hypothetical protein
MKLSVAFLVLGLALASADYTDPHWRNGERNLTKKICLIFELFLRENWNGALDGLAMG